MDVKRRILRSNMHVFAKQLSSTCKNYGYKLKNLYTICKSIADTYSWSTLVRVVSVSLFKLKELCYILR